MYISEIKMHGFKSFAKKEVMKLGQGITTVVGPNGCGKTNIVDAIRWVLGEQKYTVLRSGKMEDVIFNGAEGIKPLGVCEVSMTVHNNAGKLPIEYNDIEIARRVYRSGESEYFLNKTQCRLKDIMDLFVDTGMGADAYSVIELKMIEQILSETADDRRNMFEEAAGIHKYRKQRKSTIRKFESTRADLERVHDIISEVEQKVNHLALQLKRFKRHATLQEEIKLKEINLAFLQIHRYQSIVSPLKARIDEYKNMRESKHSESSLQEAELDKLRLTYKDQETELSNLNTIVTDLNINRETIRNNILVWSEQGRGALLTVERMEREQTLNNQKIKGIKQLSLEFEKEIYDLEPTIDEALNAFKIKKKEFDKIEADYQDIVKKLDDTQKRKWELLRKLGDNKSLHERTLALFEEKEMHLKDTQQKITVLENEKISVLSKEKELLLNKKDIESNLNISKKQIEKYNSDINNTLKKRDSISEKKHYISAQIKSLSSQKEFYNELVETKEGFPEGTRFILENPKIFLDVLGTVADMFQVDESNRDALEAALGDLSHCIIVKNKNSALKTLKIARENQAGDFTLIPLKEAKSLQSSLKELPKSTHLIGRASELVQTSKELKPLADYLLGDILIIDNLESIINTEVFNDWGLVDQSGMYSGSNLIIKNRQISEHGNVLGRHRKLENIESQIESLNIKQKALISDDKLLNNKIKVLNNKLEKHSSNKTRLSLELSHNDTAQIKQQYRLSQIMESIKSLENDLKDSKKILSNSKKAIASLKPLIIKDEKELQSFENVINETNEFMLTARNRRDEYQRRIQETRIKLIELETRRDQVSFKKLSGEETRDELIERQSTIKDEIIDIKQKKSDLDQKISSGEKELKNLDAQIQKKTSILDLKKTVFRDTYEMIEEIQTRISSDQRNREKILEDLKNAELEASQTEQLIRIIQERIFDRYDKKIPKDLVVDETEEQLEIDISRIQRSLENIGPVNMAVQDEFNEENERLNLLSQQRDDLIEAEENLRETIRKIDKVARKRFIETFDLIKNNFEKLFHLFFEGGNAVLKLVGDPDPLESDIAIEAQPPGKRNASLRLLSSGEKALTAISLLFAIYQVKPSPYCILDEVDAPLDDINIHKFTRVLSKFCDETQFIIVTHNKLTMEIADYMYGVTQEKKGVSQLVSVKFD